MNSVKEKLSPKVEALYEAVMELLLEGKEVRKMKVSEITERAGIGKGTAYEYFESREELLIRALEYQQKVWAKNIQEQLLCHNEFMEKVNCLFDMMDNIMEKVKKEAQEELCNIFFLSPIFRREKECEVTKCLYHIVEEAKRGGALKEEFPDEYIVLALSGKIFSYVSFCAAVRDGKQSVCTPGQIRVYLLDSFRMEFLAERKEDK